MVGVIYRYRYIIDNYFISWLLNREDKSQIIIKLLRINKCSEQNKNAQILMLESNVVKLRDNLSNNAILKGCFEVIADFDYIKIHPEEFNKNIILAIDKSDEPPYKVRILTSPEQYTLYLTSIHFSKLSGDSIRIRSGEDALKTITSDFNEYHNSKDHN